MTPTDRVEQAVELLATSGPFREWLARLSPDEKMMYVPNCCGCPLEVFLANNGAPRVYTSYGNPAIARASAGAPNYGEVTAVLPAWTRAFMRQVDESNLPHHTSWSQYTPRVLLELVDVAVQAVEAEANEDQV